MLTIEKQTKNIQASILKKWIAKAITAILKLGKDKVGTCMHTLTPL